MKKDIKVSEIKDIESITLIGSCQNEKVEVIIETPSRTFRAIKTCASNIFHTTYEVEELIA